MTPKFLILSLPRSRSFWLSKFLSYGGRACGHDLAVECSSIKEFQEELDGVVGSCETGAVLAWKLLRERMPSLKLVVIRREVDEVMDSFARLGLVPSYQDLVLRNAMLEAVGQVPGVKTFGFEELEKASTCAEIFEHCLDIGFDGEWWEEMRQKNLQINMVERLGRLLENASKLESLKDEILLETSKLAEVSCSGLN